MLVSVARVQRIKEAPSVIGSLGAFLAVPGTGIEPVRPSLAKGF